MNSIVLGGTFDLLHLGHKAILAKAFSMGKFITIGLTTDKFNKSRAKLCFENQNLRLKNLKRFLDKSFAKRYKVVFINDIFGESITNPNIEGIIVTADNLKNAKLINQKRVKAKLKKIEIITCPLVKDETSQVISSTRIRNGQISQEGTNYKNLLLKMAGKQINHTLRQKLQKPLGKIVTINNQFKSYSSIISVGDITTQKFLDVGITPKLAVVDLMVERKKQFSSLIDLGFKLKDPDIKIKNPPGQISKALILAIEKALRKFSILNFQFSILVDGEEDLAAFPAILLAPLGTTVFYGQPQKGTVKVLVDLKIKNYLQHLVS